MRVGVAGLGRIGALHVANLLASGRLSELVVTDPDPVARQRVSTEHGVRSVADADMLLTSGLDALVVASPTPFHAELIRSGVRAGIPTFCEKPLAGSLAESIAIAELEQASDVPIQIGFQRRFDAGYMRAHAAVHSGELGTIHTLRASTLDSAPPPAAYIAGSGGLFRDCSIHDFDIIRYVSGSEVEVAYAVGSAEVVDYIAAADDVDTAAGIFTMANGAVTSFHATRVNGYGHDVRMEVHGTTGDLGVGLDDSLTLVSAEPGVTFPPGPRVPGFIERFATAYVTEINAFLDVATGRAASRCTARDGLEAIRIATACDQSRREGRPVPLREIPGL